MQRHGIHTDCRDLRYSGWILFSYAASLPVSVFRIPLCQGCVETMTVPLFGDAGG